MKIKFKKLNKQIKNSMKLNQLLITNLRILEFNKK